MTTELRRQVSLKFAAIVREGASRWLRAIGVRIFALRETT